MDKKDFDDVCADHGECGPATCRVKALIDEVVRLRTERDEAVARVKAMRLYMERDDEVPL